MPSRPVMDPATAAAEVMAAILVVTATAGSVVSLVIPPALAMVEERWETGLPARLVEGRTARPPGRSWRRREVMRPGQRQNIHRRAMGSRYWRSPALARWALGWSRWPAHHHRSWRWSGRHMMLRQLDLPTGWGRPMTWCGPTPMTQGRFSSSFRMRRSVSSGTCLGEWPCDGVRSRPNQGEAGGGPGVGQVRLAGGHGRPALCHKGLFSAFVLDSLAFR